MSRTYVIEGKPEEEVTIRVPGQSLTLTKGIDVTVIVVVNGDTVSEEEE